MNDPVFNNLLNIIADRENIDTPEAVVSDILESTLRDKVDSNSHFQFSAIFNLAIRS